VDLYRYPLIGLGDRLRAEDLAAFLGNPHSRYPDGRMPRLPIAPDAARNIAAFLLLWSKPSAEHVAGSPPAPGEIDAVVRRLRARAKTVAAELIREKRCAECHPGLGPGSPDVPLATAAPARGCLSGKTLPRFGITPETRQAIEAYLRVSRRENHPSPF